MAFWNKETPDVKAERLRREQEQEQSQDALEAGKLPLQAERRLREAAGRKDFFTSDLSVNEHLLLRQAGFEPVGQVMGSAFVQLGWGGMAVGYQQSGELQAATQAHLRVRALAVSRLGQEAEILGAHGVVGVNLELGAYDWSRNVVECTAFGTAVRRLGSEQRQGPPFTSNLSGQDFWKLHDGGYLPREIAFGTCSYYLHSDFQTQYALASNVWGSGRANQEIVQYTQGFQHARHLAMTRFTQEVQRCKAQGAVGVNVSWHVEEIEYEINETTYRDLLVHFTALGTAISDSGELSTPSPTLTFYDLKDRGSFQLLPTEE